MHVGVVGCGYWGPNLIRNLAENRLCRQVYLRSRAGEAPEVSLRPAARAYPVRRDDRSDRRGHDRDPALDPLSLARQALLKGKHIFVEKPFTGSSEQALS